MADPPGDRLMRAMVMESPVGDLQESFLAAVEIEPPVLEGPFDVVVDVAGAGVCRTDLEIVYGVTEVPLPLVLGHENSGKVSAVGSQVSTVSVGDPVLCYPFKASGLSRPERRGLDNAAPDLVTPGMNAPGGFAEQMLVRERSVVRVPEGADLVSAATLADGGLAAYRGCRKALRDLSPTDTVVVIGVGGLGHLAIQVLAALSPNPIVAVDVRPESRELALELGATRVFDPADPSLRTRSDAGAVLDFVGSDQSAALALSMLRFGGAYVAVGVGGMISHPILDLARHELRIEGVFVGTYTELTELTDLFLGGMVRPRIVQYPLAEAEQALRDLAAGRVLGRAVLVP